MGNIIRIGDPISCGAFAAAGSSNVFANGMPVVHEGVKTTTGHGCFPPTVFITGWSMTVFVNTYPVAIKGQSKIQAHRCGNSAHDGVATVGSPDVSAEA